MNIIIPRRKVHYKPLVWKETHELVTKIAEQWGKLTIVATYHIMAEVASHFDSAEEFAALASTLQPERLAEGAEEVNDG